MQPHHLSRRTLLATTLAALAKAIPLSELRLGVTSDEIDEDPRVSSEFLNRFGIHYAEVRNLWGKYNTAQPPEKVKEAQQIFAAQKVQVQVLDTAFFRGAVPADATALDKEWMLLEAAMDRADIFGAKVLRIFAFLPKDGNVADTSVQPRSYELLTEAAARAQKRGLRLAVENLKGSYVQTAVDSARMLKNVKAANLGMTWDPNNAASCGETPFPDGYRLLDKARIFNVHVRDFRHTSDGKVEWAAVGQGEFDNVAHIRALRKDGYRGPLTLETHWRDPKGKAYSTEVSLTALLKQLEKV